MAYSSSASDRLTAVRAAIDKALYAQSYGLAGRNKSMPSLGELRKLESELMLEVAREGGGLITLAQIDRPA